METITINSGHVSNALDSQIILLVKTLQIEQKCSFEDALETARDFLNKKIIELMVDKDKALVKTIALDTKKKYKENPNNADAKKFYSLCNYYGLYKDLD